MHLCSYGPKATEGTAAERALFTVSGETLLLKVIVQTCAIAHTRRSAHTNQQHQLEQ